MQNRDAPHFRNHHPYMLIVRPWMLCFHYEYDSCGTTNHLISGLSTGEKELVP